VSRRGPTVGVVGLGAMGSATAYHLAASGARVIGFEALGPAHDRGSSHGESRIIRQAYFEDPCYVPLLLRAYQLWRDLERDSRSELLLVTRGMMLGDEGSPLVAGSLASCRQWHLPHRVLREAEIRREFPAFAPPSDVVAVLEPLAGVLRPEEAVLSHLRLAAAADAELRFWTRVTGWEPKGPTIEVVTESGRQRLDKLVITAGAWTSELLAGWSLPLEVERQLMVWLAPGRPAEFDPQRFPVFLYDAPGGLPLYGFPSLDSRSVKAARHHGGEQTTPANLRREWEEAEAVAVRDGLADLLPGLVDARLVTARVCMYTNTPDLHFAIGAHPQDQRVQFACGFSGHGFKFSTVIGEIMAELALNGRTRHPIEPLRAARLS
jgi:sarcosine oxidase